MRLSPWWPSILTKWGSSVSARPVSSSKAIESEAGSSSGLNVLVAEDNLINQRLISALLTHCGHEVVVVEDGEQAVNAVREQVFDVVLMDIHMPNVDGLMATQQIREMVGSVSEVPIVAVTANSMNADRAEYLSRGLTGFVAKPIDPDVLMAEIQAAIADHVPTEIVLSESGAAGGTEGSKRRNVGDSHDVPDVAPNGIRTTQDG